MIDLPLSETCGPGHGACAKPTLYRGPVPSPRNTGSGGGDAVSGSAAGATLEPYVSEKRSSAAPPLNDVVPASRMGAVGVDTGSSRRPEPSATGM